MYPALAALLARSARWAEHPLAKQAAEEIASLVGVYVARQHAPQKWALFHKRMAETLPSWRVLARAHHRRMARRYSAFAWVSDEIAASKCGLPST